MPQDGDSTSITEKDDEERVWLDRWREGDSSALKSLFKRHADDLTRYLTRRVSSKREPDLIVDLVHSTFLTLRKTRTPVTYSVRAFIYGVAYNELRHRFRGMQREDRNRQFLLSTLGEEARLMERDDARHLDVQLGARMSIRVIGKALRRLEIEDQLILELHYWEENSRAEMAEILGIAEGTVAGRLRAARQRLAAKFKELSPSVAKQETSKTFKVWLDEITRYLNEIRTPAAKSRAPKRSLTQGLLGALNRMFD